MYRWLRNIKTFSLMGSTALAFNEKVTLEKKWTYYNRLFAEPTQLQRTLTSEARVVQKLQEQGWEEQSLEEKRILDPATAKIYNQMYQLPPQRNPDTEKEPNTTVRNHWGSS